MTHEIRVALAGTFLLTAALAAWTVGGDPPEADANRDRIAMMSQAERDRLQRAYDEFRRLPPADQAAVRRLQQATDADGALGRTLLDYGNFLDSLTPAQREELRQQADPRRRVEKVAKLVDARDRGRGRSGRRFVEGPTLSPSLLDKAASLVLDSLDLPASEKDRLRATDPAHVRHLQILQKVAERFPADRWRDKDRSRDRWPEDATVLEILKLHPEDEFRDRLLKDEPDPARRDGQRFFRRSVVIGLLTRSLLAEWHGVASGILNRDTLRIAFEQLPQDRRDKLADLPPGELVRVTIRDVLAKRDDAVGAFAKGFDQAAELRDRFDPMVHGFGRRGAGPPFGGPDNDRRGDGNRNGARGDGARGDGRRDGPPDGRGNQDPGPRFNAPDGGRPPAPE